MKQTPGGRVTRRAFLASAAAARLARGQRSESLYVVPNFHPASCGWLTNFSKERVYCANSYFDHLDRVRDDPNYSFVLSEVNNMIAMLNFQPRRAAELKKRIAEGRVELVNAFFLESTVNLSGGEALVRLGIEGLRYQEKMFGVRPRFGWMIDICGMHEQMAQICAGLGLEAMVYCRKNPTGKTIHWSESPDGTRILTLAPGHYSHLRTLMTAKGPLGEKEMAEMDRYIAERRKATPEGAPLLALAGSGDYALAPARAENPSAFLKEWRAARPGVEARFTTLGKYLDAIKDKTLDLPTMRGGTEYDYLAFWIQCPRVKRWYRDCEHLLQAAEMAATCAAADKKYVYPSDTLHQAWVQMFLNMDRNTLWGAAGGMVFEHDRSWDARDRFEWVEQRAKEEIATAARSIAGAGDGVAVVNSLSWPRSDPFFVPAGSMLPVDAKAATDGDRIICQYTMRSGAVHATRYATGPAPALKPVRPVEIIRTRHYTARIDLKTGALVSLKTASGRELLGGPANTIVYEKMKKTRGNNGDHVGNRPDRERVAASSDASVEVSMWNGLAAKVEARGSMLGKPCVRRMWFYANYPRIDFETELNDVPDLTLALAEFPLAEAITEVRRGVPYGFSHGAWSQPNPKLPGWTKGVTPAVRWSDYQMPWVGGLAILDRGLSGRELVGQTPLLFLYNAVAKYRGYPNSWLSGEGRRVVNYALVPHELPWEKARIPQMAFEFNSPPVIAPGCAPASPRRFFEASDNMIVESIRRDGPDIEVRMVECLGVEGAAQLTIPLPYTDVAVTDMTGRRRKPVERSAPYRFLVRPQEILTVRFRAEGKAVAEPKLISEWDALAPQKKRAALREYTDDKGHPPAGV